MQGLSNSTDDSTCIFVYMLYDVGGTKWQRHVSRRFFAQNFMMIRSHLLFQPIFSHPKDALAYARSLGSKFLIVEALVPQTAVRGNHESLSLKSDDLSKEQLQGLYPSWHCGRGYIENPGYQGFSLVV